MDTDKPKNRRKTYRHFGNFDIIKGQNGNTYIRFPNEREHIPLSVAQASRFVAEMQTEIQSYQSNPGVMWVHGSDVPYCIPFDARGKAVVIAKKLLTEPEFNK